jgi:hypothetical protein
MDPYYNNRTFPKNYNISNKDFKLFPTENPRIYNLSVKRKKSRPVLGDIIYLDKYHTRSYRIVHIDEQLVKGIPGVSSKNCFRIIVANA